MRAKATTKTVSILSVEYTEAGPEYELEVKDNARSGHVSIIYDEDMYAPLDCGLDKDMEDVGLAFQNRAISQMMLHAMSQAVTDLLMSYRARGLLWTSDEYVPGDEEVIKLIGERQHVFDNS